MAAAPDVGSVLDLVGGRDHRDDGGGSVSGRRRAAVGVDRGGAAVGGRRCRGGRCGDVGGRPGIDGGRCDGLAALGARDTRLEVVLTAVQRGEGLRPLLLGGGELGLLGLQPGADVGELVVARLDVVALLLDLGLAVGELLDRIRGLGAQVLHLLDGVGLVLLKAVEVSGVDLVVLPLRRFEQQANGVGIVGLVDADEDVLELVDRAVKLVADLLQVLTSRLEVVARLGELLLRVGELARRGLLALARLGDLPDQGVDLLVGVGDLGGDVVLLVADVGEVVLLVGDRGVRAGAFDEQHQGAGRDQKRAEGSEPDERRRCPLVEEIELHEGSRGGWDPQGEATG